MSFVLVIEHSENKTTTDSEYNAGPGVFESSIQQTYHT